MWELISGRDIFCCSSMLFLFLSWNLGTGSGFVVVAVGLFHCLGVCMYMCLVLSSMSGYLDPICNVSVKKQLKTGVLCWGYSVLMCEWHVRCSIS